MKYEIRINKYIIEESLPLRGAWIEIASHEKVNHGFTRRSPYGERGLKLLIRQPCSHVTTSLPLRGAWIEIYD